MSQPNLAILTQLYTSQKSPIFLKEALEYEKILENSEIRGGEWRGKGEISTEKYQRVKVHCDEATALC